MEYYYREKYIQFHYLYICAEMSCMILVMVIVIVIYQRIIAFDSFNCNWPIFV